MSYQMVTITATPLIPFSFICILRQSTLMTARFIPRFNVMFKAFTITVVHVNLTDLPALLWRHLPLMPFRKIERARECNSQSKVHHNDKVQCIGVLPLDLCIDGCNLSYNNIA